MALMPQLVKAEYVPTHALRLSFADGTEGIVDLTGDLWGEVFEPLRDPAVFRQFHLNHALNAVAWPTGADLAPEFLYERAQRSRRPD